MGRTDFQNELQKRIRENRFISDVRIGTEHDMEKHTGQSTVDLMNRIFSDGKQVVSSFHDKESVNPLIQTCVQEHLEELALKMEGADQNDKISISHAFDHKIGTAIRNNSNKLQGIDTNAITVIFTKDVNANRLGLKLTTAYLCIDKTQCLGVHLTRNSADLASDIRQTWKYQHASTLGKACMENMCDMSTAQSYMVRSSHSPTGEVCFVKSMTEKMNYFLEIEPGNNRLRTEKQDRLTHQYLPVTPVKNSKKTWQTVTPELEEKFRQQLPKLITTADTIRSRCQELELESTKEYSRQKSADTLLSNLSALNNSPVLEL